MKKTMNKMNAIQTPANESELKYDWGEITLQDQRIISVNVEDWELFSSILKDGEIIEQNSLFCRQPPLLASSIYVTNTTFLT